MTTQQRDDAPTQQDDGTCPDCLPRAQCDADADDARYHAELDRRLEESA